MMNIHRLDEYKLIFEEFVDTLPIAQMEGDISQSSDALVAKLYQSILSADQQTLNPRYKAIYHKIGILGTYTLFDVVFGDYISWILSQIKDIDLQAKGPEHWRVNEEYLRRQEE